MFSNARKATGGDTRRRMGGLAPVLENHSAVVRFIIYQISVRRGADIKTSTWRTSPGLFPRFTSSYSPVKAGGSTFIRFPCSEMPNSRCLSVTPNLLGPKSFFHYTTHFSSRDW